jgi:chromosome segregation ATPase
VTAIDQMARVYRWACSEKRRTLEDLLRLADRLRADIGRLGGPSAVAGGDGQSADERRDRLVRSIAGLEATIERAREELGVAEAELARVEQMKQGREAADKSSTQRRADKTSTQRRNERAAGLGRKR